MSLTIFSRISIWRNRPTFWWSSTGIDYFRTYHAKLRAVTRADINKYLTTYVIGKNHVAVALATPEGKKEAGLTEQDLIGGAQ